jgi:hypothetical protein
MRKLMAITDATSRGGDVSVAIGHNDILGRRIA